VATCGVDHISASRTVMQLNSVLLCGDIKPFLGSEYFIQGSKGDIK